MNCFNCGSPLPDDAVQCPFCGAEAGLDSGAYDAYTGRFGAASGNYAAFQQTPGRVTGSYGTPGQSASTGGYAAYQQPAAGYGAYQQPGAQPSGSYGAYQQPAGGTVGYAAYQQPGTQPAGSYGAYQPGNTGAYAPWQQTAAPAQPEEPAPAKRNRFRTQYGEYTQEASGYRQPGIYGRSGVQRQTADSPSAMTALSELPRDVPAAFTDPGSLLRSVMERRDAMKAVLAMVITLVLAFLSAIVVSRGFLNTLVRSLGNLKGYALASLQGVNSATWQAAPLLGGVAVLWTALSSVLITAVYMGYLCGVRKINFSWEMAYGYLTVTAFPAAAAALAAMLLSILSPWLALPVILCGLAARIAQAGGMLSTVLGQEPPVGHRLLLAGLSALLIALICGTACGLLGVSAVQSVLARFLA